VISQIVIVEDLIGYQKLYGPDHPFVPLEYIVSCSYWFLFVLKF